MTDTSFDTASVLDSLRTAAQAALGAIPSPQALEVGTPGRDTRAVAMTGSGARARFSGPVSGTVLIVVDDAVTESLASSPMGPLSPAQALQPALDAAARTIGQVALGPVEQCEVGGAIEDIIRLGGAVVPLTATDGVHAVIGLVVDETAAAAGGAAGPGVGFGLAAGSLGGGLGGLDLLRGVEMEVSAELGRARMSLDELLNLGEGAVIELDRAAGAPADLLVNGRLIARGEVVVVDENFGLRITEIITDAANR